MCSRNCSYIPSSGKTYECSRHTIHVETQGVIGQENPLTDEQIAEADVVILAIDVSISGKERFKGKKVIEVPTKTVVHSSEALIKKIEAMLAK